MPTDKRKQLGQLGICQRGHERALALSLLFLLFLLLFLWPLAVFFEAGLGDRFQALFSSLPVLFFPMLPYRTADVVVLVAHAFIELSIAP